MEKEIINFIRDLYNTNDTIPLHSPTFKGNEKEYVLDTIESTFVSSVGKYVDLFEEKIQIFTKTNRAVATVNGTSALHTALYLSNVRQNDLVITQPLTFIATCNAIHHLGAQPIFIDVDKNNLSLCPIALETWLDSEAIIKNNQCYYKKTNQIIKAIVPMHTFGHPAKLDELKLISEKWRLILIEDAAESLGSYYKGKHTGTIGKYGILSFNGNKTITTGGGGMILCKNIDDGLHAKHITTTAKIKHPYEFFHDEIGFNYRMPNINAALGVAQIENLSLLLKKKKELANHYKEYFKKTNYVFIEEPDYAKSNYWLNAIICDDKKDRDHFLSITNNNHIITRPIWTLMHNLPIYSNCIKGNLKNSEWLESRVVNIPSTPII